MGIAYADQQACAGGRTCCRTGPAPFYRPGYGERARPDQMLPQMDDGAEPVDLEVPEQRKPSSLDRRTNIAELVSSSGNGAPARLGP
jgi:hypothetical protein